MSQLPLKSQKYDPPLAATFCTSIEGGPFCTHTSQRTVNKVEPNGAFVAGNAEGAYVVEVAAGDVKAKAEKKADEKKAADKKTPDPQPTASPQGEKSMKITVTSSAFKEGSPIPKKHTGEGDDVSPTLEWLGVPEGTKQLALICDDPDAPRKERSPAPHGMGGCHAAFSSLRQCLP